MTIVQAFLAKQQTTSNAVACRKVAEQYVGSNASSGVRTDLEQLARDEGIVIHESDRIPAEGMYQRSENGGHSIVIRRAMNRRRQRFTLAHELAHYIIRKEAGQVVTFDLQTPTYRKSHTLSQACDEEERLADLLAAELLLPHDAVAKFVGDAPTLAAIKLLCRKFGVSRVAAIRRVADVANRTICLATLVPRRFANLTLPADLDEMLFAFPSRSTVYGRQHNCLKTQVPFDCLGNGTQRLLSFNSSFGQIDAMFETEIVLEPRPHAFALTSLEPGWRE